ncbi:MAG: serine/threonine-protein kinase [Phycisphaerales bacterium]
MTDTPTSEREIFLAALDLPEESRTAFVAQACGGDAALERRVIELLGALRAAGDYLARPEGHAAPRDPLIGARVGAYTVHARIGEGGFGLVYVAEQSEPLRRQVALKILKAGIDSAQVIARFELERQALALMDHPNIARVFDSGALPDGRPYFVMELVRGIPVTRYCDAERLTPHQRIELFVDICTAVQHAHQKGIIHRDLKPSNVLVATQDAHPVVKVIDFGIAKAMEGTDVARSIHTDLRQFLGTPAYMSPEQAQLNGVDIDTRSDVYSLGVLLYELLTGVPPLDEKRLLDAGLAEMQRIIRETDPPRPSTRVTSLGADASDIAESRRMQVRSLHRFVAGDLDWIVMKAIEKDRSRRYESAAAFAADLRRHLRHEPVEAGPPSATYRLSKFVRRNRLAVAAGSIAIASLLGGLALAVTGFVRASIDRDAAVAARNDEREARALADRHRVAAERNAERARVRSDFIAWGLGFGDTTDDAGDRSSLTVRAMLDLASRNIGAAYADSPHRQALARQQLGNLYYTLFLVTDAERELGEAIRLWRANPEGRDEAALAAALRDYVETLRDRGVPYADLVKLRREQALADLAALDQRLGRSGSATTERVRTALTALLDGPRLAPNELTQLGNEALAVLDDAALSCESDELVLVIDAFIASLHDVYNRWSDPRVTDVLVKLLSSIDARCPALGASNKAIAYIHLDAAELFSGARRRDEAARLTRLARAELSLHLPRGHWLMSELTSLEGAQLTDRGDWDAAEPLLIAGCDGLLAASGRTPEHYRPALNRIVGFELASGRTGLLARFESPLRTLAPEIERMLLALRPDGTARARAAAANDLAAAVRSAPRGADDPRPETLATILFAIEPYADAVSGDAAKPCRELLEALSDFDHYPLPIANECQATARWWAGVLALSQNDLDAARNLFEASLASRIEYYGPDSIWANNCRRMLGRVLLARGEVDAAATTMLDAYHAMQRSGNPAALAVIAAARDAALGLGAQRKLKEAGELLASHLRSMLESEDAEQPLVFPIPPVYLLIVARPLALLSGLEPEEYRVAEDAASRAAQRWPESGLAPLTIGASRFRQGRCAEAIESLAQADSIDVQARRSPNPVVALFRAACMDRLGRADAAQRALADAKQRAESYSFDRYSIRSWQSLVDELAPR